jgi:hypothetical protein
MARSQHIYIIEKDTAVVGAFTVKGELVAFLNDYGLMDDVGGKVKVYRLRDNHISPHCEHVFYSRSELVSGKQKR